MSYDFSNLRIVLVDDSLHMRKLIRRILLSFSISDIVEVTDGNEAIQAIGEKRPDIVLTDLAMEPVDGLELTRFLRLSDESPDRYIPIIMMTAYTEMHRVIGARDAGVTEIVAKPVSATGLLSRLTTVLERPRPFFQSHTFFGPDRRRRTLPHSGRNRRVAREIFDFDSGDIVYI